MTKTKIPEYLSKFAQDNNEDMIMTSNHAYVIAPQKIIRCFRLNEIEKLVLLELLSLGEKDCAFPSHKRLAFKLGGKSVSSIKKALNSLKDKGFIKWSKGDGDIGQIVIDYWSFV
ncbi:helix-turn-helix domain-containing protein [Lysinibacillus fusiformis]